MMDFDELLARFDARPDGAEFVALCPAHDDHKPTLAIRRGDDGRALLCCRAGCDTKDILAARGLAMKDLFPPTNGESSGNTNGSRRIVATYDYRDAGGELVYQVVRFEPKDFRQRRPDGNGGWTWSLKGVHRVLYRLPELIGADPGEPVYLVEGEKDADALAGLGLVATCNAGGAGKWSEAYSAALEGRHVVILPDADGPGEKHARDIAAKLMGRAASVRIVHLPDLPDKGDVSDWLQAGGTADELRRLVSEADEFRQPVDETFTSRPPVTQRIDKPDEDEHPAPAPILFGDFSEQHQQLRHHIIDGVARAGETVNIISHTKIGKSWLAVMLMLCIATGRKWLRFGVTPGRVLLIDNELHPETLAHRIRKVADEMFIPHHEFSEQVEVMALRGQSVNVHHLQGLLRGVEPGTYAAIIIDAWYRILPPGTSESDNAQVREIYDALDRLADRLGCTIICVHHTSKGMQSDKRTPDVGSGAGSMSRATDAHVVLREHEQDDHVVLDAAVRSFPPVEPVVLRWEFPLWHVVHGADPTALKQAPTRGDARQERNNREGVETITKAMQEHDGPFSRSRIRSLTGIGYDRVNKLLRLMQDEGTIEITATETAKNGEPMDLFTLTV